MQMPSRSIPPWLYLTFALCFLIGAATMLAVWVPGTSRCGQIGYRFIVGERPILILDGMEFRGTRLEWIEAYDLRSLELCYEIGVNRSPRIIAVDPDGKTMQLMELLDATERSGEMSHRWFRVDVATGETIDSKPVIGNADLERRRVSGTRFIDVRSNQIRWIDFSDEVPEFRDVDESDVVCGFQVADTDRACLFSSNGLVRLVRLDDGGELQTIASWETSLTLEYASGVLPLGQWRASNSFPPPVVASVSPGKDELQLHSLVDGLRLKSIPVPDSLCDELQNVDSVLGSLLWNGSNTKTDFFDVELGRSLTRPVRNQVAIAESRLRSVASNQNLFLWGIPGQAFQIVDERKQQTIGTIASPSPNGYVVPVVETGFTAMVSDQLIFSIAVYETAGGRHIGTIRPYLWAAWCLPAVVAGYLLWGFRFLRISSKRSWRWFECDLSWMPVAAVALIPVLLLGMRTVLVGDPSQVYRLTYHHLQGIGTCGISLALVWLVFGRAAWAIRVICLGCTLATILLAMRWTFADSPENAWYGLVAIGVPSSAWLFMLLWMRWRGWSFSSIVESPVSMPQCDNVAGSRSRVTIGQMLGVTTLFAVLLAIGRPFWPTWEAIATTQFHPIATSVYVLVSLLILSGATLINRTWHVLAWVAIVVMGGVIIAEPTVYFIRGQAFLSSLPNTFFIARITMTYSMLFFASLLFYRWRGWRFRRIASTENERTNKPMENGESQSL